MSYQGRLVSALREGFTVESVGRDEFLVRAAATATDHPVLLIAPETDVAARVTALAGDAVEALGVIGGDASGEAAGMGLLAVHVEELIASDPLVRRVVITSAGLRAERA